MMEQQTIEATAFGRVLGEFMERRELEATPEQIVALGERSGLDGEELLYDVRCDLGDRRCRQRLMGLAEVLRLSDPEKERLAMAYTFEVDHKR
jgi:hypothetical protein